MTPRIVIHAGFHKTGTTSAQAALRENADLLKPHLRCFLKDDFLPVTKAARALSRDPNSANLATLSKAAQAFFGAMEPDDARPVLMSSEDLSGHMPGRHGLTGYDCAPLIMNCLARAIEDHFGSLETTVFCFSTRDTARWTESTWWQNLRSTRLTKGLNAYASDLAEGPALADTIADIAAEVAPAFVASFALEEVGDARLGPVSALLDFADVPAKIRDAMVPVAPENVRPGAGIEAVFLALNRSGLSDTDVQQLKRQMRRMARAPKDE